MSLKDMKYLQIYAQHSQHFEAFIVGNREGLLELRKMIDETLKKGTSEGNFFPSDDEGYQAYIALIPDEKEELFQSLELPYTDQFGYGNSNQSYCHETTDEDAPYSPIMLFKDSEN